MKWIERVVSIGEVRNAYTVLVGRPPLARPRHRWENIKMDFAEIECEVLDWIHLAQDSAQWRALVNTVMNLRVPSEAGNLLVSCATVRFPGKNLLHVVDY
jgi:hypothetical protein